MDKRPIIGVTLDSEQPGGYSKYPWYAIRQNYADAITAAGALPIALPHDASLAAAYLDRIDALVVTGGAFDVDPALYGDGDRHATVTLKGGRHAAQLALRGGAEERGAPSGSARSRSVRRGERHRAGPCDRRRGGSALPVLSRRPVASRILHRSRRPSHLR